MANNLRETFPRSSVTNRSNIFVTGAEFTSNGAKRQITFCYKFSNLVDAIFRKFRTCAGRAQWNVMAVTTHHISRVIGVRSFKYVFWVYTRRVVARVTPQRHRPMAVCKKEGVTVRVAIMTIDPDAAIATFGGCTFPEPASSIRPEAGCFIYLVPEPLFNRNVFSWMRNIYRIAVFAKSTVMKFAKSFAFVRSFAIFYCTNKMQSTHS